jgi:catechol 2,3-dioxygenase-like lactoylglutathione lyase family enzyme
MKKTLSFLLIIVCLLVQSITSYAKNPAGIVQLNHVAVLSANIDSSLLFYRDFLGFKEMNRLYWLSDENPFNAKKGVLELVNLKISDKQTLEVFTGYKSGAEPIFQIAYQVKDIYNFREILTKNNFEVEKIGRGQMKNFGACYKEPNGYTIELSQFTPEGITMQNAGKFIPENPVSREIYQVGIVVKDKKASDFYYKDLLGFRERQTKSGTQMWFPESEHYIQYQTNAKAKSYICFEVKDIKVAKAYLENKKKQANYKKPIEIKKDLIGNQYIDLIDPIGLCVKIMQPKTSGK